MSYNFCHISPTAHLKHLANRDYHLTLAHLVETDQEYVDFYLAEREKNPNITIIMDNSAFEMFKQHRPMYPPEKLMEMANKIKADYIVMSDYPNQDYRKTIDMAEKQSVLFKAGGFGTFFVPQSEVGDIDGMIKSIYFGMQAPLIDYIGFSIIAAPNLFGVESDNKMQRFLSRWHLINMLESRDDFIHTINRSGKKIHFLGMVDGPNEIQLIKQTGLRVDTWDSSAAVWLGLHNLTFDDSPTGLIDGKFEQPVIFDDKTLRWNELCDENIEYIDHLCQWN